MDKKLRKVTLGGLLHDIGKVIQRTGGYGRRNHSDIGAEFIENRETKHLDKETKNVILDCIRFHHKDSLKRTEIPDNSLSYIIYEADNVASGLDRRKEEKEVDIKGEFDRHMVLNSVFPNLMKAQKGKNGYGYKLRTLSPKNKINYPVSLDQEDIQTTFARYFESSQIIETNLEDMRLQDPNSVLEVLEATASYIPSSTHTNEVPDISLFDHLKLTAAIAGCIYLYYRDEKGTSEYSELLDDKQKDEKYYRLVSADISGIQNFIYTTSSKRALKSLRARSFYLDLMLEHISDEILEKMGLSRANLLYTGGGHFYMLLPNTGKTRELLDKASKKINEWMLNYYGLKLFLAIADEECSSNDLKNNNKVGDIFKTLTKRLSKIKLQRYDIDQLERLFSPDSDLNDINAEKECKSCRTSSKKIVENSEMVEGDEIKDFCENCLSLIRIGKRLVKHQEGTNNQNKKDISDEVGENDLLMVVDDEAHYDEHLEKGLCLETPSLNDRGKFISVLGRRYVESLLAEKKDSSNRPRVYSINKWMQGVSYATKLWVGDYVAKNTDEKRTNDTIDFEQLEKASKGVPRLAVLRADVDNLGTVFTGGFKKELSTISRYATLSRHLSLFFKHYINSICTEKPDDKWAFLKDTKQADLQRMIAIVYSGGDDLFAVGAWNEIIQFALDLREAFRTYTCDTLTFSAGIGFFKHSFPITQMAAMTGKLEDLAKNYPDRNAPEKDAVALFGLESMIKGKDDDPKVQHVYSWDKFTTDVLGKMKEFLELFSFDKRKAGKIEISTAALYRLMGLIRAMMQEESDSDKTSLNNKASVKGLNLARFVYAVSRMEPGERDSDQLKLFNDFKEKLYEWVKDPPKRKSLLTAINLLVYMHREKNENERGE